MAKFNFNPPSDKEAPVQLPMVSESAAKHLMAANPGTARKAKPPAEDNVVRPVCLPKSLADKLQNLADELTLSAPRRGNFSAVIRRAIVIAYGQELGL